VNGESPMLDTRIGVGVLVLRNGRVLLGERRGSHGAGTWAPPGGHLEPDEDVSACAQRELLEETGLVARTWCAGPYSVDDFPEIGRRYVTLFVIVTAADGEAELREPDKCASWSWYAWDALTPRDDAPMSRRLFTPLASLVSTGWRPAP